MMKQIIIKLSLIFLYTQSSLFSMDQTNPPSQEEIIGQIYSDIYKKYGSNPAQNDLFYGLTNMITQWTLNPSQCLDIIQIVEGHCARNTTINLPDTFDKLYNQNNFFKSAIDELTRFADYNLTLLTANNITTIENPKKQQPTPALNQLSLPIKTYVMNRALKEIDYTYDIVLSGQHPDDIQAFDICELTDQAVTSSFNSNFNMNEHLQYVLNPYYRKSHDDQNKWNSLFLLWDLKTGKVINKFDESSPINLLAFNPDGSCIAAALYNENTVKVWCPKTRQLLHSLACSYNIRSLHYSYPIPSILTAISLDPKSIYNHVITQWALRSDHKAGELLNCSYIGDFSKDYYFFSKDYYFFNGKKYLVDKRIPSFKRNNELTITKKDCAHLWMCLKAIKRIDSSINLQNKIESCASFQSSTSWERGMIYSAIQRKQVLNQKGNTRSLELINFTNK